MKVKLIVLLLLVCSSARLEPLKLKRRYQRAVEDCATPEIINERFHVALSKLGIANPATATNQQLVQAFLETSKLLVSKCGVPKENVPEFLDSLELSSTELGSYCPAALKVRAECDPSAKYRSYDGQCNNLDNPRFGAVSSPYRRLLPPSYEDGIDQPRLSVTGEALPSPRAVVQTVHNGPETLYEAQLTAYFVSWGQLMDHDIVSTTSQRVSGCCDISTSAECMAIAVAEDDSFYSTYGLSCLNFVRSAPSVDALCKLGHRDQSNSLTSLLDASFVYGVDEQVTKTLRLFDKGLLRTQSPFQDLGLKDLPPFRTEQPSTLCFRDPNSEQYCFLTGDVRSNQTPLLSVPHALFVREHNRIANELRRYNPTWDDETIFQETRRIVAAIIQKITYSEFLPLLIGPEAMERYGLAILENGYYEEYDQSVNPTLADAFNSAAYRLHSTVPRYIHRWSVTHQFIERQILYSTYFQPWDLMKPGYFDQYLVGLMNQNAQHMDNIVTDMLRNNLNRNPGSEFGVDLASINIQRGRDHGMPSYNTFREYSMLEKAESWEGFLDVLSNQTVAALKSVYKSFEDVDLWSAGISEKHVPGGIVGPTFAAIIAETFKHLKSGDRFWFENRHSPHPFTLEQLNEIRKVTLARIICDNGDGIDTVQKHVMEYQDPTTNPRTKCSSLTLIPRMDFSKWKF